MKPIRFIFYATLVICFFCGLYSGYRVFYYILFVGLLTIAAVLLLNVFTIYSFKYSQTLARDVCEKGETSELNLELLNESFIPLSLLVVTVEVVSPKDRHELILNLEPFSGRKFQIPVQLPYRGYYMIGMTKIQINDIFGLIPFRFDMRSLSYYRMKSILVLPRAEIPDSVSAMLTDSKSFGELDYKPADQGDSVSGARLYQPGDAVKRINWKKSAQQSALFVKQYDKPDREKITILMDSSAQDLSGEDLLRYSDTVCECAASITLHTILRNREVKLISSGHPDKTFHCFKSNTFEELRRMLALLEFKTTDQFSDVFDRMLLSSSDARELFIITRNFTAELNTLIKKVMATHRSVTRVIVGGAEDENMINTIYIKDGGNASESIAASMI